MGTRRILRVPSPPAGLLSVSDQGLMTDGAAPARTTSVSDSATSSDAAVLDLGASPAFYGMWDNGRGQSSMETAMASAISWPGPEPLNTYDRGYMSTHPTAFSSTPVADYASWNNRVMLNLKISDWSGLAAGTYDSTITSFWNSWPLACKGWTTCNHEPENDGRNGEAAAWRAGMARWISVSAARIRARGLDVGVGGCLMGYSFEAASGPRYSTWNWWDLVAPVDLPQTVFMIDHYSSSVPTPSLHGHDIIPDLQFMFGIADAAGISRYALFETNVDRRQKGTLNDATPTIIGTDAMMAAWWTDYADQLETLFPGLEAVCAFHSTTGPASQYAQLQGAGLTTYAQITANGRRS